MFDLRSSSITRLQGLTSANQAPSVNMAGRDVHRHFRYIRSEIGSWE
jgi:hypothetical protein